MRRSVRGCVTSFMLVAAVFVAGVLCGLVLSTATETKSATEAAVRLWHGITAMSKAIDPVAIVVALALFILLMAGIFLIAESARHRKEAKRYHLTKEDLHR